MKVVTRSTGIVTAFYLLMGFFGYFATVAKTSEIVLFREPLPGVKTDYYMMASMIAVLIVMIANCVTNFMPFRNIVFYIIYEEEEISKKQNLIITGSFYTAILIVSIIFPRVTSVLGIFGGLTSTSICYVIPCKVADKYNYRLLLHKAQKHG